MLTVLKWGLVGIQVCTDIEDRVKIEAETNKVHPTGIQSQWCITEEGSMFLDGSPNPNKCDDNPNCKHWHLTC